MFDYTEFQTKIRHLISLGETAQAERELLEAAGKLRRAGQIEELESVLVALAHFYSMPKTEDLAKAESYFLGRELLSPTQYALLQTATFYFYVSRDFPKTIAKVDQIRSQWNMDRCDPVLTDRDGDLRIAGNREEAKRIHEETLKRIKSSPARPPDRHSYYSALALKGQAHIAIGDTDAARLVLEEMLSMIEL